MGHVESFESVAGCRIRILRKGAGTPLLFLHGASGISGWMPFMEGLSRHHDLIVPEHPGYGQSDTPDWLDGIGDMAYFYLDLIAQMGLRGVHLMGNSLGGWIAAEMAVRDPAAMRSLTLISPAGIQVKGVTRGDIFMLSPAQTAQNLFHDPDMAARVPLPQTDGEMMQVLKNRETTARLGWNPRLHNPDLPKWLHRVAVPTLIVWGDDDRVLPAAYGPAFRDLIPGADLTILQDCGHLPHVEKTAEFTQTALRFLQRAA